VEKCVVLSFSPDILRRIKEIEPSIQTCLNYDASAYRPTGRFWPDLPKGCAAIGPHAALATGRLLAEAKEAAFAVHVWTVNEPEAARQLASWGAASVISDDVAVVGAAIRAVTGARPPLALVRET
jgi:glycerophosphoryl diester phosphodiesterase